MPPAHVPQGQPTEPLSPAQVPSPAQAARAWTVAAGVPDPELRDVTIADLGVLRDVTEYDQGAVHVRVTPTWPGADTMDAVRDELVTALSEAGYRRVDVEFVLAPAWRPGWMTPACRAKLAAQGTARRTPYARFGG